MPSKNNPQCEKCNGIMDRYYGLWCPKCNKPEVEIVKSLNLIKCLRHLIAIGEITEEDKSEFWDGLCKGGFINNDSSFSYSN